MSLARLWADRGDCAESAPTLSPPVYHWFTDKDLIDAKELLDAL